MDQRATATQLLDDLRDEGHEIDDLGSLDLLDVMATRGIRFTEDDDLETSMAYLEAAGLRIETPAPDDSPEARSFWAGLRAYKTAIQERMRH